ncbi:MAG: peptidase M23 [Sulfurimonas sp.]|nr:MAG: peptidase M23 [Sulfurimonas sp.]
MRIYILILFLLISSLVASDDGVIIKARKSGEYVAVEGMNNNPFSVTVAYNANYINLKSEKKLPMLFVLKAFSKKEVLKLHIKKNNFSFKAHYDWTIGSKDARHDNSYVYRLPYNLATKQMVSQGFNGKFSHYGKSQYAVDFNMKEATGIYAAREGVVVKTKSDSNLGGANRTFEKYGNYITIEHSDETLATYSHLKQNGVVVKVGEIVKKGQLIGYSGKTGYARGAHLHFIVYKATDGKSRKSFPVKFMSAKGVILKPIKGRFYEAK